MKFTYKYRSSDNAVHDCEIRAANREDVYRRLKAKGVKPYDVLLAPGVLNKVSSLGRRWIAIIVLGIALLVAVAAIVLGTDRGEDPTAPLFRHHIYGDGALMAAYEQDGYAAVFTEPGDRFLARFSQPGVYVKSLTAEELQLAVRDLSGLKGDVVGAGDADTREAVELRRVIRWMRGEMANYLAAGTGTVETYIRRLVERQHREFSLLCRAKNDLKVESDRAKYDRINESLRTLGIETIPYPGEGEIEK